MTVSFFCHNPHHNCLFVITHCVSDGNLAIEHTYTYTHIYTQKLYSCVMIFLTLTYFFIYRKSSRRYSIIFFGSLLILFCKEEKERTREYADVESSILLYIVQSFLRLDYPKGSGVFV